MVAAGPCVCHDARGWGWSAHLRDSDLPRAAQSGLWMDFQHSEGTSSSPGPSPELPGDLGPVATFAGQPEPVVRRAQSPGRFHVFSAHLLNLSITAGPCLSAAVTSHGHSHLALSPAGPVPLLGDRPTCGGVPSPGPSGAL